MQAEDIAVMKLIACVPGWRLPPYATLVAERLAARGLVTAWQDGWRVTSFGKLMIEHALATTH